MKKTEAYFIDHCEDENGTPCGLGSFKYKCPECGKWGDDYDVWYKDMELYKGNRVTFKCENCGIDLITFWDGEEHQYFVIK